MLAGRQHDDVLKAKVADEESRTRLVEELKRRGNAAFKARSLNEADALYSKAIEHAPDAYALYSNRSATRAGMGKFAEALEDADECSKLKPDWAKAHMRRGQALNGLKRFREAHGAFQRALEIEPSNKQVKKESAEALRKAEDSEASSAAADKSAPQKKSEAKRTRIVQQQPSLAQKRAPAKVGSKKTAEDMRGYRVREDGTVTSYFTMETSAEAKALIGDVRPKKLSSSEVNIEAKLAEPTSGSAWNKGATFEERDMSAWAKKRLVELLRGVQCRCPGEGKGKSAMTLEVVDVEDLEGDASISFIRGSKRFIFDFSFGVKWRTDDDKLEMAEEGVIFYPDFSSSNNDDEIETELRWTSSGCVSPARQVVLRDHLGLLRQKLAKRLDDFKDDFKAFKA